MFSSVCVYVGYAVMFVRPLVKLICMGFLQCWPVSGEDYPSDRCSPEEPPKGLAHHSLTLCEMTPAPHA